MGSLRRGAVISVVLQAECEKVKTAADGSVIACKYTPLPAAYTCNSMGTGRPSDSVQQP